VSGCTLVISSLARDDIRAILEVSEIDFGSRARGRYSDLIGAALEAIRSNPVRPGATARPDIGAGIYAFHLAHARRFRANDRVRRPRHFLIYRFDSKTVIVGRVLHDAMDIAQHPPED
jgi:toxin ParE1/3/4